MEKKYLISGIQQLGVGNPNVHESFKWFRQNFGMDVKIFEEAASAELMLPYTGGQPRERHAILAINLQGGGGFEIWQYTSRTPVGPDFEVQAGDLGIYVGKMKSPDVQKAYAQMRSKGLDIVGELTKQPNGADTFFVKDNNGNIFQVVPSNDWFTEGTQVTGGAYGAIIGVTNIERAQTFYSDILGYDEVVYDKQGTFDDFAALPGGTDEFRRVLLRHSKPREGGFSRMLGSSEIELIQVVGRTPRKIFENRMWGDLGFIHLCYDIKGMDELKKVCESKGYPFTVDSSQDGSKTFDMGEAAGRFSYVEDPDGALIEFVETHKMPLVKKIGWYLDLRKRDPKKPLPDWMLKLLRFSRVKN